MANKQLLWARRLLSRRVRFDGWMHYNDGEIYKEPTFLVTWFVLGRPVWSKKIYV